MTRLASKTLKEPYLVLFWYLVHKPNEGSSTSENGKLALDLQVAKSGTIFIPTMVDTKPLRLRKCPIQLLNVKMDIYDNVLRPYFKD